MSKLDDIALRRSLIDGSVTVADADWLIARVRKLETALTEIACFDDQGANQRLANTGSYSMFDEPGSVEQAREALKED